MTSTWKGLLILCRPANLPTAMADILAGTALAGTYQIIEGINHDTTNLFGIVQLLLSSLCLYAGGVVLNDVFDVGVDRKERPERPIPSGTVSTTHAAKFGSLLLIAGIFFAFTVNPTAGLIALALAGSIILYDGLAKKHAFFGPLSMGLCRGLNLLLGAAIFSSLDHWYYAFIPITYIFAITLISRGEVHGNNKNNIIWAGILYTVVIILVMIGFDPLIAPTTLVLLFLSFFAFLIFGPLIRAYRSNSPTNIRKAVKTGVLSIIILDASIAAGHSFWWIPVSILLLFPLSIFISRSFAVT